MPNDIHDDIRRLLVDAVADLPALAPAPQRTVRRARRRIVGAIGALTVVVGIAVSGAIAVVHPFQGVPASQSEPHGVWLVDVDTGAASQLAGVPEDAFWFTTSLDGSTIAFTVSHGSDPARDGQVYVMAADGSDLRKVTHERYGASEPTLSPDGSEVAYVALRSEPGGSSRNVVVVDTSGLGTPVQVTHERNDVASLAWSSVGDSVLYSVATSGSPSVGASWGSSKLMKVDVASHESTHLAGGKRVSADFGTWSANGSEIAYMTGHERGDEAYGFDPARIMVMNSDGGDPHLVTTLDQRAFELLWRPYRPDLALTTQEANGSFSVNLFDVATREIRYVTDGVPLAWLNVHTLIVGR
jgi:Tol biopolymer transport system component